MSPSLLTHSTAPKPRSPGRGVEGLMDDLYPILEFERD
jgi:hypothetical protein